MNDKSFEMCNFLTFNKLNDECSLRSFKKKIKFNTNLKQQQNENQEDVMIYIGKELKLLILK